MTRNTTKRMTAAEFEAVRPLLSNISKERIEAARLALVDGQSLQGIATIYGWTRQAMHQTVGAVWGHFEKYSDARRAETLAGPQLQLPPGWEQVTLVAPSVMVAQFREQLAQLTALMPAPGPAASPAPAGKNTRAAAAAKKKTRSA